MTRFQDESQTGEASVGVPLPPMKLRLHRDSDENLRAMGGQLASLLYRLGLRDGDNLLDVGCGVGRLPIGLLATTTYAGRYVGFDVSNKHVRWARRNLSPIASNFKFRTVDVHNARYNPDGQVAGASARFPVRSDDFDVACLFSIFTHFEASDIASYLHELNRVLKPGGTVVATWFLWDQERRQNVESGGAYPMVHQRDEDTLYADESDPLWAIAHHLDKVRSMVAEAGLQIEHIELGTWAQGPGPELQDLVVLRKPLPRLWAPGRLRRRFAVLRRRIASGRQKTQPQP
jgi:SAM-dependent methyltransferase